MPNEVGKEKQIHRMLPACHCFFTEYVMLGPLSSDWFQFDWECLQSAAVNVDQRCLMGMSDVSSAETSEVDEDPTAFAAVGPMILS